MNKGRLIRKGRFRATHHYGRADWSEEENRRVFGAQTEPHQHDWHVEVHVTGPIDPVTGWVLDLSILDGALAELMAGWDGGDLNALIPGVRDGAWVPSTENLARHIFESVRPRIVQPARLREVRVFESPGLGSAYPADGGAAD